MWEAMNQRCNGKRPHYGGRGIRVCGAWGSFAVFLRDMGKAPSEQYSLDRIDNNGNYEPGNCRWATRTEQNRNKRNNRRIEFRGRTQLLVEWAEELSVPMSALSDRINKHKWTVDRAFSTPFKRKALNASN